MNLEGAEYRYNERQRMLKILDAAITVAISEGSGGSGFSEQDFVKLRKWIDDNESESCFGYDCCLHG